MSLLVTALIAAATTCGTIRSEMQLCHQRCDESYGFTVIQAYCTWGCGQMQTILQRASNTLCEQQVGTPSVAQMLTLIPDAAKACRKSIASLDRDLDYLATGCEIHRLMIKENYEFPYP